MIKWVNSLLYPSKHMAVTVTLLYIILSFSWLFFQDYLSYNSILIKGTPVVFTSVFVYLLVLILISRGREKEENLKHTLEETEQKVEFVSHLQGDWVFTLDIFDKFTEFHGPKGCELVGYSINELLHRSLLDLVIMEDKNKLLLAMYDTKQGHPQNLELGVLHKEQRRIDLNLTLIYNRTDEKKQQIYAIARDITEQKLVLKKLHDLQWALDESAIVTIADPQGNILYVNDRFCEISKHSSEELLGQNHRIINSGYHPRSFFLDMWKTIGSGKVWKGEILNQAKDGSLYWVFATIIPFMNEKGKPYQYVSIRFDITEKKRAESEMEHMAFHDTLTGLPNRRHFERSLQEALAEVQQKREQLAVLFIDVDRFKFINDTLGHAVGDQLLQIVGKRVTEAVRSHDMVARMGGDEFTIICTHIKHLEDIERTAKRIIKNIQKPIVVAGQDLHITISMGISLYPDDGISAEMLMQHADLAMYQVKENTANHFSFYKQGLGYEAQEHVALESALRKAIEREELELVYQPQVYLDGGDPCGVECLLRWNHPTMGQISPVQFIPLAERTGLIIPIGEWVLRKACEQAKIWEKAGYPIRIAVNLSPAQLEDRRFSEKVENVLYDTGLNPQWLELELTEGMVMNTERVLPVIQQLKALGLHLSIDDFGTGYSSLSYLHDYPIDRLKIDRSFIKDLFITTEDTRVVETIIHMAHILKLKVIAEGVETEEQMEFLQHSGCDEAQGYFYSRPISAEEFEKNYLIQKNRGCLNM